MRALYPTHQKIKILFMSNKGQVGGQAVVEGVMMRSRDRFAVAVRQKDGSILVWSKPWNTFFTKHKIFSLPFIRGVIILIESLREGILALKFSVEQLEEKKSQSRKGGFIFALIIGFILGILLFKGVPHLATYLIGKGIGLKTDMNNFWFHITDGTLKLGIFISYIAIISLYKDIRQVFMYHGAEHKSIFAYEETGKLSVEIAKDYPRFHPRCGTSFIIFVILISIIIYSLLLPLVPPLTQATILNHTIWVFLKIILLIPIASITYEFNRWAGFRIKNRLFKAIVYPGLLLQYITTREPQISQLEVAIVALGSVLNPKEAQEQKLVFANFQEFIKYNFEEGRNGNAST